MWIRTAMICPVVLVILSTISTKYVTGFLTDPEEFLKLDLALRLLSGRTLIDPFQELFPHPFYSDPVSRDFREPEPSTPAPPTTTISPLPIYSYQQYSAEPKYSTLKDRQVQIGFSSGNLQNNDRGSQQFNSQSKEQFNRRSNQRFGDQSNQRFKDQQNQQFNGQSNQQFNGQSNQQFNSQPNQQFSGQPNQQFSGQPNQQSNSQTNQFFDSQPNQQFNSQPNQQFNSQPNQQFNSQSNQQFNSQPNQQFNSQSNQQFNSQPNQQFNSQSNQQFNSQPNQQFNSQSNQQFQSQPNQQFNSQSNQQFRSQPNQKFNSQSNQLSDTQSSVDQLGLTKTLKFLKNYRTQKPNSGKSLVRQPKSEFQAFGAVPYQRPQEAQPVLYSNHYYQKTQYQTAPDASTSYRPYDQSTMYRQPDLSTQYYSSPYTYSSSQSQIYNAPTMNPDPSQNNAMYYQYSRPYQPTKQASYQTNRLIPDTGMMIRAGEGIPIPSIQPQFNYSNTPTTPVQYRQPPPQVNTRSYYPTSSADNVPILQQIPRYQNPPQTYTQQGYSAPTNQRLQDMYMPVNQPQPINYYPTMTQQNLIQQPYLQPTPSPPKSTTVSPANQQEIEIESPENPPTTPTPVTTPLPLFIENVLPASPTEINGMKRFYNQPNQPKPRSPTRDQLLYLSPEFHHSLHLRGF